MRFLVTDAGPVNLTQLGDFLRQQDPAYAADFEATAGALRYQGVPIAGFEVNTPAEDLFHDELAELRDAAAGGTGPGRTAVEEVLRHARAIVAVQVLGGHGLEETLERLDPVWRWFFRCRKGLLQADGEGYYDAGGRILTVE